MSKHTFSIAVLIAGFAVALSVGACKKTAPAIEWDKAFDPPPQVTLVSPGPTLSLASPGGNAPPADTPSPPAVTTPGAAPGQPVAQATPAATRPPERPAATPAPPATVSPGQTSPPSPAPTLRGSPTPAAPRSTSSKVSSSLYFLMHLRGPQANQIPEIKAILDGIEQKGGVEVTIAFELPLDSERISSMEKQFAGLKFIRMDARIDQAGAAAYDATVPFDQLTPLAALPNVLSVAPAAGVRASLEALGH